MEQKQHYEKTNLPASGKIGALLGFFRKYLKFILPILGCIIVTVTSALLYYSYAQTHVFLESQSHLNEIYNRTNVIFGNMFSNNRKLLLDWEPIVTEYADDANQDETAKNDLYEYLGKDEGGQRGRWGFEDFFFIGVSGTAPAPADSSIKYTDTIRSKSYKGNEFTLRTHRSFDGYLKENAGGVVFVFDGETQKRMLFAIPVEQPKTFEGFSYSAIGFSFTEEKVLSTLSRDVYNGEGQYCVALGNGDVLMKTDEKHKVTNVFEHFYLDNVAISNFTVDDVKQDWKNQTANTIAINEKGQASYFSYRPVGFGGWMLVGIISASIVNKNMNTFGTATIAAITIIFLAIGAAAISLAVSVNRQRIKNKTLEVTLRENLLDTLSLNSNDIFIVFSGETFKADYVSSNISRVLGLDLEKVRNDIRSLIVLCPDGVKPFTSEGLMGLPVGKSWDTDIKLKHISEDIYYFYRIIISHSLINEKDTFVMMMSDRTSDKSMQEKLTDALNIAKSANDAKSNFLSNMSHDIRTPMNAIIGYSTLLAKESSNPERVRDYTKKITYSGQHLLGLINDILDMSKIESGKTSLNIEEFSLPEFIEELYSIMESQAAQKKLKFEVHAFGNLPERVLGDKLRLNRVILNVLSNAVKYTPSGGAVDFRIEALTPSVHNHAHIKFTVSDTGIGMSPEFIGTIFEPFTRDVTAAAKSVQGTGLGMAIAKNIVDLMGGIISVDSTLGKGSIFAVELELAVAGSLPDDDNFWQHQGISRLLVVDDSEDVCVGICELMADTGVKVDYALSGKQAIARVKSEQKKDGGFDAVLLDWKMPDMDGLETARRLRELVGTELPIIVLTSYSYKDIEAEAAKVGIDTFMSKPFFVSSFKRAVMQLKFNKGENEAKNEGEDISLQGLKVLAAEDNALNAEILVELLDIEGVECDVAGDGKAALEKFRSSAPDRYDMIFMDIQMPIMNGYEAAAAIRACDHERAKVVPIIAMTANAFDTDVKAALDAGMNAHVAKPIDMIKLKRTIAKIRK